MNKSTRPDISIIVATYQRVDCLDLLLNSFKDQTAKRGTFEVIVVDNGSDLSINSQVRDLCSRPDFAELDLHYIHHPVVGLSTARNRGVTAARSALVGFLDDDCLLKSDWVEKILQVFLKTKADILGGPTEPYYLTGKPYWFRDTYLVTSHGDQACWLTGNKTVSGGNMVWRKQIIEELGGFSTSFGYVGKKKVFGEETELNLRARQAGYTTWYDPCFMVQHYADPKRMRVGWLFSSGYRYGQIKARLNFRDWRPQNSQPAFTQILVQFKNVILNFINFLGSMVILPFRSRLKYPYWQNYAIEFVRPRIERLSVSIKLLENYFSKEGKS